MKAGQWLIGCLAAVLVTAAHAEKGQAIVNVAGDAEQETGGGKNEWAQEEFLT